MVCRCASAAEHSAREYQNTITSQRYAEEPNKQKIVKLEKEMAALTPDHMKWEMIRVEELGFGDDIRHIIAEVKFTTCEHAGYGGRKILVFRASLKEAILWRHMDPHFRDPNDKSIIRASNKAPIPIARFPASDSGWEDAKAFLSVCTRNKSKTRL